MLSVIFIFISSGLALQEAEMHIAKNNIKLTANKNLQQYSGDT